MGCGGPVGAGAAAAATMALLAALLLGRQQHWLGGTDTTLPGADELLQAGRAAAAQQRWLDARGAFSLAIERLPTASASASDQAESRAVHSRAQFMLGFVDARLGRHAEAADAYRRSLSTAPVPSADPHWNLALSLKELGRLSEAVEHFGLAAEHAPAPAGNPTALFQQGRALESLGRATEAVDGPLRAAVASAVRTGGAAAVDTDYPVALGLALASIGRNVEAAAAYADAVAMIRGGGGGGGPADDSIAATGAMELGGILINWGNALHAMGRLHEAAQAYRHAVDAAETVQLEAAEALAATLTALEQQEQQEQGRQQGQDIRKETGGQDLHADEKSTAAVWAERARAIGRSQEAYYGDVITRLPPLTDYNYGSTDQSHSSRGTGGLRMRVRRLIPESSTAAAAAAAAVGAGVRGSGSGSGSGSGAGFGVGVALGLATPDECDALIALALATGLRPATVGSGSINRSIRRSSSVSLPHWRAEPAAIAVVRRLAALLNLPLAAVIAGVELHAGHYKAGEAYPAHHDASATTRRWVTLLLYLSDAQSHGTVGGHTVFVGLDIHDRQDASTTAAKDTEDEALSGVCAKALRQQQQSQSQSPSSGGGGGLLRAVDSSGDGGRGGGGGFAYEGERGGGLLWSNYRVQEEHGSPRQQGRLDQRAWHSGCEVKAGEKWVLNIWIKLSSSFVAALKEAGRDDLNDLILPPAVPPPRGAAE